MLPATGDREGLRLSWTATRRRVPDHDAVTRMYSSGRSLECLMLFVTSSVTRRRTVWSSGGSSRRSAMARLILETDSGTAGKRRSRPLTGPEGAAW
jgi:hypothetical protein